MFISSPSRPASAIPNDRRLLCRYGIGLLLLAVQQAFGATAGAAVPTFPHVSTALNSTVDSLAAANIPHHAFFLSDIVPDLSYETPPLFIERGDGTASIQGVIRSTSNPIFRFIARVDLGQRVVPGDANYPPLGSPKLELLPTAYKVAGGPIDPNTFYYYKKFSGSLFGLDGMAGCRVALAQMGPAFQVGQGANGMNGHDGMSSWFTATTTAQAISGPALPLHFEGDINNDRDVVTPLCARAAVADSFGQFISGFAIYLPGIENFTFEAGASFLEQPNGTAKMVAIGDGITDPNAKIAVAIDFSQRIDPTDPNYPPAGSPKEELIPTAYVQNGGPVDPSLWHYYQAFHGTLTGQGSIAGAVIDVVNTGPAFQVGLGANGKNIGWGASGWMDATVLSLPTIGAQWPQMVMGDINVDLRVHCVEPNRVTAFTVVSYGQGCAGFGTTVPTLATIGSLGAGTQATLQVAQSAPNTMVILLAGINAAQTPIGFGCQLLIASPVVTGNPVFTDAVGQYSTSFDLPLALVGQFWRMQAAVAVPQGGFAMTNGLWLEIQ